MGNCLCGELSEWGIVQWGIVLVGNCPVGNCPFTPHTVEYIGMFKFNKEYLKTSFHFAVY